MRWRADLSVRVGSLGVILLAACAPADRDPPSPEPFSPPVSATLDGSAAQPNPMRCFANFRPRTIPERDVERLGILCGGSMRRVLRASGSLDAAGATAEHRIVATAGACIRGFAVGGPTVADLDLELYSEGRRVAFDTGDDRWPIVAPDGPTCLAGQEHVARVRAQRGSGPYAIEIYER